MPIPNIPLQVRVARVLILKRECEELQVQIRGLVNIQESKLKELEEHLDEIKKAEGVK